MIEPAEKLKRLPPYLFARINALKLQAYEKKIDVIDLGMGNPDLPTPRHVVDRLCETVQYHPKTHRYPQAKGMLKFRKTVADWYLNRFNVKLDPESEVLALIGSKEGIAHLCFSFLNPGDIAIVPDPAYPVYYNGVILADGEVYSLPLLEKNNYLPNINDIPADIARRAKLLFLNYPNNPTGAVIEDMNFLKDVVKFAKEYNIIVCYDNAYSELTFDNYVAGSFLQIEGARDIGVEFHSCSKTYSMAGWRVGFVVGNSYVIGGLTKFKSFVDYGVPTFIQLSAVAALNSPNEVIRGTVETYRARRDLFINYLNKLNWYVNKPKATMYIWARIPQRWQNMGSLEFSEILLNETGIVVAPGIGFGKNGEGYIRIALVVSEDRIHDAYLRLKKLMK